MNIDLGLEAINFQPNSPFAKDLIEVFQAPIELRQKLKDEDKTVSEIANAVEKHFFKICGPELCRVLFKHTGIPVGKLYVTRRFSIFYACAVEFGNDYGANMYSVMKRCSGIETDTDIDKYVEEYANQSLSPKEVLQITSNLDLKTGKMNISKIAGKDIRFILQFDYNSAFLAKETGHIECEYMTAEEVAAIVLHEIGHMITLFEHASDMYFKASFYNHLMAKGFVANADKYQLIFFALNALKTQFPKRASQLDAISDKVKSYQLHKRKGSVADGSILFISLLYDFFAALFSLIFSTLTIPLGSMMRPILDTLTIDKKISDYGDLKKQAKYCERIADEYVSRHGLSAALESSLHKFSTWCKIAGLGTMIPKNSSLAWSAAKIPYFIYAVFHGNLSSSGDKHDPDYERALKLMDNTLRAFRAEGLDKEQIDYFLRDYENLKRIIVDIKHKNKFERRVQLIHDCMNYILATPVDSLFTGRFLSEYNKLHDQAESLVSNTFAYHKLKLEQLKKKL